MSVSVTHATVASGTDAGNGEIHKAEWNAAHTVTGLPATGVAVATAAGTGSADYTTSSATYVDVDGTNLSITTTNAQSGDVLEIMALVEGASGTTTNTGLTFSVAGTDVGDTLGLAFWSVASPNVGLNLLYYHTMADGTQVTIKLRWKTASSTASMYNRSAVVRPRMVVKNLSRGGTL